jgi:hypothetical protein
MIVSLRGECAPLERTMAGSERGPSSVSRRDQRREARCCLTTRSVSVWDLKVLSNFSKFCRVISAQAGEVAVWSRCDCSMANRDDGRRSPLGVNEPILRAAVFKHRMRLCSSPPRREATHGKPRLRRLARADRRRRTSQILRPRHRSDACLATTPPAAFTLSSMEEQSRRARHRRHG